MPDPIIPRKFSFLEAHYRARSAQKETISRQQTIEAANRGMCVQCWMPDDPQREQRMRDAFVAAGGELTGPNIYTFPSGGLVEIVVLNRSGA